MEPSGSYLFNHSLIFFEDAGTFQKYEIKFNPTIQGCPCDNKHNWLLFDRAEP
jgi:hypothetical protein